MAFAQKVADDHKKERLSKTTVFDISLVDGEYCTFSRMWQREGGDEPAFSIACNWMGNAMALHQQGKTLGGNPWLKWDPMRSHAVCLHYRDRIKLGGGTQTEMCTTATVLARQASSQAQPSLTPGRSSSGQGQGTPKDTSQNGEDEDTADATKNDVKPKAKAKAKGKAKACAKRSINEQGGKSGKEAKTETEGDGHTEVTNPAPEI